MAGESAPAERFSSTQKALAWSVHFFTGLGLPLALLAALALPDRNAPLFFTALAVACFVDAIDGTMARAVRIKEVLPDFDGRKLDDIIDFLNFAFLPSLGLVWFGMLPPGWEALAAVPLMASGYGFCQEAAKTEDSFVGFPSYWNILVLYYYLLKTDPYAVAGSVLLLSALVFVPLHYLYPTKAKFLRRTTLGLGAVWTVLMFPLCVYPDADWARPLALFTLLYPAYYMVASVVHHLRGER